jgi:hypothetical protein
MAQKYGRAVNCIKSCLDTPMYNMQYAYQLPELRLVHSQATPTVAAGLKHPYGWAKMTVQMKFLTILQ